MSFLRIKITHHKKKSWIPIFTVRVEYVSEKYLVPCGFIIARNPWDFFSYSITYLWGLVIFLLGIKYHIALLNLYYRAFLLTSGLIFFIWKSGSGPMVSRAITMLTILALFCLPLCTLECEVWVSLGLWHLNFLSLPF